MVIQEHLKQAFGANYSIQQIRSKYSSLKWDFDTFIQLKNNSGFGWDEESQLPMAENNVWESYLQSHPSAKKFRKTLLKFYKELEELFHGVRATGKHVQVGLDAVRPRVTYRPEVKSQVGLREKWLQESREGFPGRLSESQMEELLEEPLAASGSASGSLREP